MSADEIHLPDDAALVLVDVQQGLATGHSAYYGGARNHPDAEQKIGRLLAAWRASGRPVFHVRHDSVEEGSPLRTGAPGNAVHPAAAERDGEPVFRKNVNSGFIGTDLEGTLRDAGISRLVVAGLTTNHCVSTTVRMAANLGFDVLLVGDAAATFDRTGPDGTVYPAQLVHDTSLASLHGEFARVVDTAEVLAAAAAPVEEAGGAAP